MKTKLVIGMCLFPFIACCQIHNDNDIDITIKKKCVQYNMEREKNVFTTYSTAVYTIYNTSDSIVWLWFEENSKLSEERKLKEYFFREKGNLNLFHLLTDANVNIVNDFSPVLFYSFLKYVNPHSTFTIQLFFSKELSDIEEEPIFDYLDSHLVLVPNEKFIKYVRLPKMEQLNQFVFYQEDFIVLPISLFTNNCVTTSVDGVQSGVKQDLKLDNLKGPMALKDVLNVQVGKENSGVTKVPYEEVKKELNLPNGAGNSW